MTWMFEGLVFYFLTQDKLSVKLPKNYRPSSVNLSAFLNLSVNMLTFRISIVKLSTVGFAQFLSLFFRGQSKS